MLHFAECDAIADEEQHLSPGNDASQSFVDISRDGSGPWGLVHKVPGFNDKPWIRKKKLDRTSQIDSLTLHKFIAALDLKGPRRLI